MDITLNFINQSDDQNNSQVVIFQRNVSTDFNELAVAKNSNPRPGNIIAWKMISDSKPGDECSFTYPDDFTVNAGKDSKTDGEKLASVTGLTFKPTIWVGVHNEMIEGEIMNSAILSDINTEISLLGITKANLIMTGGGPGATSPFKFTLEPIT